MARRRRSKASRMASTSSNGPDTAAKAAACATLHTFEVRCPCRRTAPAITCGGPIIHPTRHPVMAKVLATPLTTTHRSAASGACAGRDENPAPPYTRCS